MIDEITSDKYNNQDPKKLINISYEEMNNFCGNVIQLNSQDGTENVVMSTSAYKGFSDENRKELEKSY